ncbi:hypothetical protein B0H13DRAFT_1644481, partial [Mycena leptocephala]
LRCNTDVTSLLSGASIKAVVAYISDYVTKATLKLYHIVDTVRTIVDKKGSEVIGGTEKTTERTRAMVMKMVIDIKITDREPNGFIVSSGKSHPSCNSFSPVRTRPSF